VTFVHFALWPFRGVHFSVTRLAAVCEALLRVAWAVREDFVFVLLETVFFVSVVVFFFTVLLEVFFLRSVVFARCVFCTAECRACCEAFAAGVKINDVNSKAQSVIEILFIRATGHSPD
jgi:hypothetical protein